MYITVSANLEVMSQRQPVTPVWVADIFLIRGTTIKTGDSAYA